MSNYLKIYVMKKCIKNSLVLLMLFISLLGHSNEFREVNKDIEREITNLFLKDVEQGSLLRIIDDNGLVLFKEANLKGGDYSKGFDLTLLPDGSYYFELQSVAKLEVIPFDVLTNKVSFNKAEKQTIYIPKLILKGKKVYISQRSVDSKPLKCAIYYDENDDLVLEETLKGKQYMRRTYDFSISEKGTYTIVFKSEGRVFTKKIEI